MCAVVIVQQRRTPAKKAVLEEPELRSDSAAHHFYSFSSWKFYFVKIFCISLVLPLLERN